MEPQWWGNAGLQTRWRNITNFYIQLPSTFRHLEDSTLPQQQLFLLYDTRTTHSVRGSQVHQSQKEHPLVNRDNLQIPIKSPQTLPKMSGYLNNLFTNTASKLGSIKQNLLPSENDGDTEDDTHICRVLRGYYIEKGRSFPGWLPPDPRAPVQVVQQPVYTQSNVGRGYGGLPQQGAGPGSGQLSSLWDSQPQQQGGQGQQEPQSLRAGRGAPGRQAVQARHNPFAKQAPPEAHVQARPLPSQRAGSMQPGGGNSPFARPDSSGSAMSAKDRLKGQFGQKRSASPVVNDQGAGYRNDSYSSSRSNNSQASTPYPPDNYGSGSRGGNYNSGGGGAKPYVSATSPWASSDQEFGGYEPAYDTTNNDRRQQGLPSGGPRGGRGGGLPSGPRGPRY